MSIIKTKHCQSFITGTRDIFKFQLRYSSNFTYDKEKNQFNIEIPEYFNFAKDTLDKWAEKEKMGHRGSSNAAFWLVRYNGDQIKWTFQEFVSQTKKSANVLNKFCELEYKDRAMIILPKIPEWWLITIGCIRSGAIFCPGTTQLRSQDMHIRFEAFKPKVIITDPERAEIVDEIIDKHPYIKFKVLVSSKCERRGWISFNNLLNKESDFHKCAMTKSGDSLIVYFTSGTEGSPKMVEHTHASYGLGHIITGKHLLDATPQDVVWGLSDTGWAKLAYCSVFGPWSHGACVFIDEMPTFDPNRLLQTLQHFPISVISLPPTAYRMLVTYDLKQLKFPSLRYCSTGGESLGSETLKAWKRGTGLDIYEGYGQTETSMLISTTKHMEIRPGSMGKPVPGYDVKIVDDEGNEVKSNLEGNIAVRVNPEKPITMFNGYFNDKIKTNLCYKGNFYLTGDRGYMDDDGYFWFIGRADDVIISAGYRIGPSEVENFLLQHPAVVETAVVSSPDSLRGEIVKAFIVLSQDYINKDTKALVKELQEHVKSITAPYKYPRQIEFVSTLPKTITSKIKRFELRNKEWKNK